MVDEVELVRKGSLPRTTSGKIRRRRCRELYLENRLEPTESSRMDERRRALNDHFDGMHEFLARQERAMKACLTGGALPPSTRRDRAPGTDHRGRIGDAPRCRVEGELGAHVPGRVGGGSGPELRRHRARLPLRR